MSTVKGADVLSCPFAVLIALTVPLTVSISPPAAIETVPNRMVPSARSRTGNVYVITSPNGNSVRAQLNGSYMDTTVHLGRWPTKVYGLLANANGNVNRLETRTGGTITNPFFFEQLYQQYGTSWRVLDDESLLTVCGENPHGNPSSWFFAKDLDPTVSNATKAVCEARGVADGPFLDACTLDVAVFRQNSAADVFPNMAAPVAVGQPHP
jgi:hypothetical protein